jgi:hypothetical protein
MNSLLNPDSSHTDFTLPPSLILMQYAPINQGSEMDNCRGKNLSILGSKGYDGLT